MFNRIRRRIEDMRTINHLLTEAEKVARVQGADRPGGEHLVIAALALPDGTARRAFDRIGADPDTFATAVPEQHAQALRSIGINVDDAELDSRLPTPPPVGGVYRSDVSAQQLFQQVARAAKDERSRLLGAHVVRAAARLEHGTAARTLDYMGVDRQRLAQAAEVEISEWNTDAGQ